MNPAHLDRSALRLKTELNLLKRLALQQMSINRLSKAVGLAFHPTHFQVTKLVKLGFLSQKPGKQNAKICTPTIAGLIHTIPLLKSEQITKAIENYSGKLPLLAYSLRICAQNNLALRFTRLLVIAAKDLLTKSAAFLIPVFSQEDVAYRDALLKRDLYDESLALAFPRFILPISRHSILTERPTNYDVRLATPIERAFLLEEKLRMIAFNYMLMLIDNRLEHAQRHASDILTFLSDDRRAEVESIHAKIREARKQTSQYIEKGRIGFWAADADWIDKIVLGSQ